MGENGINLSNYHDIQSFFATHLACSKRDPAPKLRHPYDDAVISYIPCLTWAKKALIVASASVENLFSRTSPNSPLWNV